LKSKEEEGMPTVSVYNQAGEKVEELFLRDDIFNREVDPHILHQVVVSLQARQRVGTSSVKDRSTVHGSGRKPFRQKGTGRARQGTRTSPLLRKGGVVFGPQPRIYDPKINKKVKRLAMRMALSARCKEDRLTVLDRLQLEEIKTKTLAGILDRLQLTKPLIVTDQENLNLERSARNLPGVKVLRAEGLNILDILRYEQLVLLKPTIPMIEEALGR
jgi:large subunit ribosomal protein L4